MQKFVTHGTFVAMPLLFRSVNAPLPPEECFVETLLPGGGLVYGVTRGVQGSHLFAASLQPPGGYVHFFHHLKEERSILKLQFCRRPVQRSDTDPHLNSLQRRRGKTDYVSSLCAAWNRPEGGIIDECHISYVTEGIQEWSFHEWPLRVLLKLPGEPLLDIKAILDGDELLCLTETRLLRFDLETKKLTTVEKFQPLSAGTLLTLPDGKIGFFSSSAQLSCYHPETGVMSVLPVPAMDGLPTSGYLTPAGLLVVAGSGSLTWLTLGEVVTARPCHPLPLAPLKTLAVLPDGRIYGLCGEGIGRFFLMDPSSGSVEDLGAVASVLNEKRYAYTFSCAAVGMNGEIYFGEDDRGGCLWVYFPPVR